MSFCGCSKTVIAMCLFITTLGLRNGMASVRYRDKRFTKVDICYETSKTLEMVGQCPTNATIFQERSLQKTCDLYPSCSGMSLVYHCVNYKDGLAEVCAPRDQITGFCCALYDEGVGRVVEDYNRPCSNCSFRYPSDNIVKYPQCVTKSEPQDSKEDTPNADDDTDSSGTPCNKGMSRSERHAGCSVGGDDDSGTLDKNDPTIYAYIIVPTVIAIVCFIVAKAYCKRFKQSKESNACLQTMKTAEIIEKRGYSSQFVLLQSNDVSENWKFTTNSKKEEPVEKLLM